MAEYDNDELTRFKQWWDRNGRAAVAGVALGLVAVIGWQGWRWYEANQAEAASNIYAQVEHGIQTGQVNDTVVNVVKQLENDYAGTPYAASAALRLAGYYVGQKDYDKAVKQLDWAMNNAAELGVRHIARVRKARLIWTQGDADEALALLDTEHPDSFDTIYAELRGDIRAAQGDREAAYKAYQLALEGLPSDTSPSLLRTKLADNAPADEAGTSSEKQASSSS